MPRRIEIELTSARPDGTWTWRAAGARQPKGVLDGGLLHEGAKPGQVLKAEAEFELEGIVITSVVAPREEHRSEPQRIEVVGPGRPEGPAVTTQLVGRRDRRGGERGERGGDRRRERDDSDRRRDRGPGRGQGGAHREGPSSGGRPEAGRREGAGRSASEREGRRPAAAGVDSGRRGEPGRGGERRAPTRTSSQAERGRAPRLNPSSAHRKAVMDSLPPEQQPIAEQLLRGGIPAVRTALHLEREKAEAEGRPAPNSDELLALAEALLPRLRAAEWRDRAEAAVAAADTISMRDLRSVVAGADVARDDETRALGATLRESLDRRVARLHQEWAGEIVAHLDAGKTVRAIRLSGRAPDPTARLEPELTARLVEAANTTLSPDTPPELWASALEAVAESPIRRSVTPAGLPADASAELKRTAHQYSGSIPALAKLLGIAIPPPPTPVGARRRPQSPGGGEARRGRPGGGRGPQPPTDRPAAGARPDPSAPAAPAAGSAAPATAPAGTEAGADSAPPAPPHAPDDDAGAEPTAAGAVAPVDAEPVAPVDAEPVAPVDAEPVAPVDAEPVADAPVAAAPTDSGPEAPSPAEEAVVSVAGETEVSTTEATVGEDAATETAATGAEADPAAPDEAGAPGETGAGSD